MNKYMQGWAEIHAKQLAFVKESVREAMSRGEVIERAEDDVERAEADAVDLAIDEYKLNR